MPSKAKIPDMNLINIFAESTFSCVFLWRMYARKILNNIVKIGLAPLNEFTIDTSM